MGTDNVELLDKRTAEVIIYGDDGDLIALVESRTRPLVGPPVWRSYWDPTVGCLKEFPQEAAAEERLELIMSGAESIAEIKTALIRDLCTSDWLSVDYWGCMAEVFGGADPPDSTRWEDFVAPMFRDSASNALVPLSDDRSAPVDTSGRYLLTSANTDAMILSLRNNSQTLRVMSESDVKKLERWHTFCNHHPDFCIVYQIDF